MFYRVHNNTFNSFYEFENMKIKKSVKVEMQQLHAEHDVTDSIDG